MRETSVQNRIKLEAINSERHLLFINDVYSISETGNSWKKAPSWMKHTIMNGVITLVSSHGQGDESKTGLIPRCANKGKQIAASYISTKVWNVMP